MCLKKWKNRNKQLTKPLLVNSFCYDTFDLTLFSRCNILSQLILFNKTNLTYIFHLRIIYSFIVCTLVTFCNFFKYQVLLSKDISTNIKSDFIKLLQSIMNSGVKSVDVLTQLSMALVLTCFYRNPDRTVPKRGEKCCPTQKMSVETKNGLKKNILSVPEWVVVYGPPSTTNKRRGSRVRQQGYAMAGGPPVFSIC